MKNEKIRREKALSEACMYTLTNVFIHHIDAPDEFIFFYHDDFNEFIILCPVKKNICICDNKIEFFLMGSIIIAQLISSLIIHN